MFYFCYGHKSSTVTERRLVHQKSYNSTAPANGARTAPGRRQEEFLDIVRCPVKFRYYFKFHGARMATYDNGWGPEGARSAFAHIGRPPDDFCLKFKSYDLSGDRSCGFHPYHCQSQSQSFFFYHLF